MHDLTIEQSVQFDSQLIHQILALIRIHDAHSGGRTYGFLQVNRVLQLPELGFDKVRYIRDFLRIFRCCLC